MGLSWQGTSPVTTSRPPRSLSPPRPTRPPAPLCWPSRRRSSKGSQNVRTTSARPILRFADTYQGTTLLKLWRWRSTRVRHGPRTVSTRRVFEVWFLSGFLYPCSLGIHKSDTIHKIMAGLLDTYLNTYNDQALAVLLKMAAFFKKRIDAVIATKGWGWWEECLQVVSRRSLLNVLCTLMNLLVVDRLSLAG